ncbi:MAG: hypothetical protein ACTHMC_13370 [Pseudobacter sp.]|uniref:hypothetical protein n=1 Tax=Pseudobacter sp. TaxID=2045420 RepID=UPI003F82131D
MLIEIYACEESPLLPSLRSSLQQAMTEKGLLPSWMEYSSVMPAAIFMDAREIWRDTNGNVPTKEELLRSMDESQRPSRKKKISIIFRKYVSFFLALVIAFFPKCPFCWAAYMSAFGVLGVDSIPYRSWYLPVSIGLLLVNILAVYFTGKRHQYKPLLLTIAGALLIIGNRIWLQSDFMMFAGLFLLVAGSAWNSLPKLMTVSVKNLFIRKARVYSETTRSPLASE